MSRATRANGGGVSPPEPPPFVSSSHGGQAAALAEESAAGAAPPVERTPQPGDRGSCGRCGLRWFDPNAGAHTVERCDEVYDAVERADREQTALLRGRGARFNVMKMDF